MWVHSSHTFTLPPAKIAKLRKAIAQVLSNSTCGVKDMQRLLGFLQWVTQLHFILNPWLCTLYGDQARHVATSYSISPDSWAEMLECLSESGVFLSVTPGTSFPLGGRLLSIRHQDVRTKAEVAKVRLTGKHIWLRVTDPTDTRRRLSKTRRALLDFWSQWCDLPPLHRPRREPPRWLPAACAADACAKGSHICIGGFLQDDLVRGIVFHL